MRWIFAMIMICVSVCAVHGQEKVDEQKEKNQATYILGSHNSGTSYKLVWWLQSMAPMINGTSRCQSKTIEEQLELGVRLFNLQIVYYHKDWYISHGMGIYNVKLFDILEKIEKYEETYFQLVLDKNLLKGQNVEKYLELVETLKQKYENGNCVMLWAWIEGKRFVFKNKKSISLEERYWTKDQDFPGMLDNVPLPRHYAKKYNQQYRAECKAKYLMLDFVEM